MTRKIPREDHSRQQTKYTTCYMCACRCGIKVTLEDNKVRFIQGNRNHPTNQGVLCAKGSAGIMKQYSTAKLTQPLMRKPGTERGEGIYEAISWEQALDVLTDRLEEIRATDPSKLAYSIGFSFWEFGAPDWDYAKYFLMWGVAEDHSSNPIKIGLEKLKRKGGKFVSVNPVRTGYSAIADEWVPIKPGMDGLFAMSIVHVLLSRELFDYEFLINY